MHVRSYSYGVNPQFSGKSQSKGSIACVGSVMMDYIGTVKLDEKAKGVLEMQSLLGAKLDADGPIERVLGGGAANVAISLKRLGFTPMVLGRIANDYPGRRVRNELTANGINLSLLQEHKLPKPKSLITRWLLFVEDVFRKIEGFLEKVRQEDVPGFLLVTNHIASNYPDTTGQSLILNIKERDRTVTVWRGVSNKLRLSEINWKALEKNKGLYISNFGSEDSNFLEEVVSRTRKINPGIFISFNPGKGFLYRGINNLAPILKQINVLNLNLQEAQLLVSQDLSKQDSTLEPDKLGIDFLLKELKKAGPQVVLITDGKHGAYAYDGQNKYFMPSFKVDVKSTLGAGDAFGSTFMASCMDKPGDIGNALVRASANASYVVQMIGAHKGLQTHEDLEDKVKELLASQPVKPVITSLPLDATMPTTEVA
jgi:sugar/nucleoside kinase (ribokinase family)